MGLTTQPSEFVADRSRSLFSDSLLGVFISLEGKNIKDKVPGLVLIKGDKGDWSADLMVFEQGLWHSFSENI